MNIVVTREREKENVVRMTLTVAPPTEKSVCPHTRLSGSIDKWVQRERKKLRAGGREREKKKKHVTLVRGIHYNKRQREHRKEKEKKNMLLMLMVRSSFPILFSIFVLMNS